MINTITKIGNSKGVLDAALLGTRFTSRKVTK